MPFIDTKTTEKISDEKKQALTKKLGEAITLINGKSEEWLMLNFEPECKMAYRGDTEGKFAFVDVKILGSAKSEEYDALTARITEIISEELGISPSGIYISYFEASVWGYNGANF